MQKYGKNCTFVVIGDGRDEESAAKKVSGTRERSRRLVHMSLSCRLRSCKCLSGGSAVDRTWKTCAERWSTTSCEGKLSRRRALPVHAARPRACLVASTTRLLPSRSTNQQTRLPVAVLPGLLGPPDQRVVVVVVFFYVLRSEGLANDDCRDLCTNGRQNE